MDADPKPVDLDRARDGGARKRVIVAGGPAAGVGKTALVSHMAVALSRMGVTVGVIDLDVRTRALARWLARRSAAAEGADRELVLPAAPLQPLDAARDIARAEAEEADQLDRVIAALHQACDVVLIDAPAGWGALAAAAHARADLAIGVVIDAADGLAALFDIDEDASPSERPSLYGKMVWDAKRKRAGHGAGFEWLIARARGLGPADAALEQGFARAATLLGARVGPRTRERAAWREGRQAGLTALDLPRSAETEAVAQETRDLIIVAKLPALEGASLAF